MPQTDTRDQVADLLAKGLTVLQVARHLNISPQAVYKHIKRQNLPLPSESENESL